MTLGAEFHIDFTSTWFDLTSSDHLRQPLGITQNSVAERSRGHFIKKG